MRAAAWFDSRRTYDSVLLPNIGRISRPAKVPFFLTEITPQSAETFGVEPGMIPLRLGLVLGTAGLIGHDIFKSITIPGKLALLCSWKNAQAAKSWTPKSFDGVKEIRHRVVRVVRDYGMFDRREAHQYYPDVKHS
jgi:hypothetical protein